MVDSIPSYARICGRLSGKGALPFRITWLRYFKGDIDDPFDVSITVNEGLLKSPVPASEYSDKNAPLPILPLQRSNTRILFILDELLGVLSVSSDGRFVCSESEISIKGS